MSDDGDSLWNTLLDCWWGQLLIGAFFFAVAAFVYWYITGLETTGGQARIHWLVAIVYNIAGKWGCVLLFAIPGAFVAGVGIRNLVVEIRNKD